ncbi:hypothetical protein [Lancefieldella parvula]|nr:hypothetical protein [Lancefieldella parvula]
MSKSRASVHRALYATELIVCHIIPMVDYGRMNAAKILDDALELIK